MKYEQRITLKNGKEAWLRNAEASDGSAVFETFNQTHAETDYLLSYPDENSYDPEQEAAFLDKKSKSPNEIEIIAIVDGKVAGTACQPDILMGFEDKNLVFAGQNAVESLQIHALCEHGQL